MYKDEEFSAFRRHPWHGLDAYPEGADEGVVQAYIEMLPSDTVKYELDKYTGFLVPLVRYNGVLLVVNICLLCQEYKSSKLFD